MFSHLLKLDTIPCRILTFLKGIFLKNCYPKYMLLTIILKSFSVIIHLSKKAAPTVEKSASFWSLHTKEYLCKLGLN